MSLTRLPLALAVVGIAVVGIAACDGPVVVDPNPVSTDCQDHAQCPEGNFCISGDCLIAQCAPDVEAICGPEVVEGRDPGCCKAFQNCNGISFTCERDPAAIGIGCPPNEANCTPCDVNADCASALGFQSFCSAGRCFSQDGRQTCTQDFQCGGTERCDATEFFCVPDAGACRFCGPDFPELCCQNGQVCDTVSGRCLEVNEEQECTVATVADDCRLGERCDTLGRCVQCIDSGDCGPNTECNPATGLCESTIGRCSADNECPQQQRCIAGQCGTPQCTRNSECPDSRQECVEFTCVLPPAVCTESDEPNNSPGAATPLATVATGYSGLLCRADQDFISFPVIAQKRYTVTVTIPAGNSPFSGLAITLFDTQGVIESSATFAGVATLNLLGVTGPAETGRFVLAVNSGSSVARDQWAYTVTVREEDASPEPDCSAAAQASQEPNDSFATATELTLGAPSTFARCSTSDVDFFRVDVPVHNGVSVTMDGFFNAEGNLNVEVFRGPATADRVTQTAPANGATTGNSELVAAPEGSTTYFLRVFLQNANGALSSQAYRLTATAVPRPAACDTDVGEPNETTATAAAMTVTTENGLVSGTHSAMRCNRQDVDHVSFTLPAGLGGTLRLQDFLHGSNNLALDLLNAEGTQLATSNTSSTVSPFESIELPQNAASQNFIARVRLASASDTSAVDASTYTLILSTFDAAQCIANEPTSDATFQTASCIGTFTSPTACPVTLPHPLPGNLGACQAGTPLAVDGCFLTCGNSDEDMYRTGPLEVDRTVSITLAYDKDEGALDFQILAISGSGTLSIQRTVGDKADVTDPDEQLDGIATTNFITNAQTREYAIRVRPVGATGHVAQVYALAVVISDPCTPDANEGANGNGTLASATRFNGTADRSVNDVTLCAGDVDIYRIAPGTTNPVRVTVNGITNARLRIAREAIGAEANEFGGLFMLQSATVTATDPAEIEITAPDESDGLLYLVVERLADAGTGPYTLNIDFAPLE